MSMEKNVFQSIFLPKLWTSNNPNKKIVKITAEDNQAYRIHHTSQLSLILLTCSLVASPSASANYQGVQWGGGRSAAQSADPPIPLQESSVTVFQQWNCSVNSELKQ